MADLISSLLRFVYYYSMLMGMLNFGIDWPTGRALITRRVSIYAAVVNVITICSLPWLCGTQVIDSLWPRTEHLHDYLYVAIQGGRVLCVCVTLVDRWSHRQRFMRLVNAFQRLAQQKPRVKRMWRRGIISKVLTVFLIDLLQTIVLLQRIYEKFTVALVLTVLVVHTLSVLVNLIISQYYFGLLNIYAHYILLKLELRSVLAEVRRLEFEYRKGVFAITCCALADKLEAIAATQSQLQKLLQILTSCFGLQTVLITISYYMAGVGMIYLTFCEVTGDIRLDWNVSNLVLLSFNFVCYFADIYISVNIMYSLLDAHAEMLGLLSESTILAPGLDRRLASVFDSFQLQLAWNPLKFSVLGLYNMEKSKSVTLASSVVTSSLVLIQNDFKNAYLY
ncbi:uncharacterized protein Dmoj_GI21134 [Drosophila mojavensis]|uniref:Gustatory receptor n=1 Tax=Drosophila mojavensis TaxID=7230 RepID=B4KS73_DROMO|nr:uncharacterized protein Dmoj_GI21134 [Drosophila mojavensis]